MWIALGTLLHVTIQEGRDLAAGAGAVGLEPSIAHTGGDTVLRRPGSGLGVVAVGGNVGERGRTLHLWAARCAIEHGDHLGG